ncbi:MAG: hypothetical protein OSJ70_00095 [Bacilli bacterium]|nr:hypothetical protein [Bacilli bacterium]
MTNILSLLRRKTFYIYTIILTIIIIVILLFFSFYNYYNEVINNMFYKNGYVYIVSRNDYTEEIKKYSDIVSLQDGIVFKPNFNDNFIVPIPDAEDDINNETEHLLYWDELLPGGYDSISVFDYDEELEKDEVIVYESIIPHNDEEIKKIVDNKISLYLNDELIILKIKNIEKGSFRGIKISKELFDELLKKQTLYVKKIKFSNFFTALKMTNDFYKRETNIDYVVSYEELYLGEDSRTVYNFRNLIDTFNIVSKALICIFIVIFAIVVKNSIVDQTESINMKRFLGYKKINVKQDIIINFIILSLTSYILAFLLSNISIIIINKILDYNLHMLDALLLIKLVVVTTILSIVLILLFNIKPYNVGGEKNEV